ncbi:hypothetical protein FKM82_028596 [Ascaphus truei]
MSCPIRDPAETIAIQDHRPNISHVSLLYGMGQNYFPSGKGWKIAFSQTSQPYCRQKGLNNSLTYRQLQILWVFLCQGHSVDER